MMLTGPNTYSGGTTISAGTLQAGSTTAFSPNSAFTVNSILDLNGFSNTIGSLAGTGTVTNNNSAPATLTVGSFFNGSNTVFGGIIQDGSSPLALIVSSFTPGFNPTLTLTGANTYTGGTIIFSNLQVGNGGTTGSIASDVVFQGGSLIFNRSNNTTFGGDISGFGQLQQIGGGTLALTGVNTYNGKTTVDPGSTLQAGSPTALSQNSSFIVNGALDLNGFSAIISGFSNTELPGVNIGTGVVTNNGLTEATLTVNGGGVFAGTITDGSSPLGLALVSGGNFSFSMLTLTQYKHLLRIDYYY